MTEQPLAVQLVAATSRPVIATTSRDADSARQCVSAWRPSIRQQQNDSQAINQRHAAQFASIAPWEASAPAPARTKPTPTWTARHRAPPHGSSETGRWRPTVTDLAQIS
eukprot:3395476-Pyramimonas_sp.AAC.1